MIRDIRFLYERQSTCDRTWLKVSSRLNDRVLDGPLRQPNGAIRLWQ